MRSPAEARRTGPLVATLLLLGLGYGLTLWLFHPGIVTFDAKFIYEDMRADTIGDWQSPVMAVLWRIIDPVAPGSASMFLLISGLYWLGFGVLALTLAARGSWCGPLLPLLALLPPAFVFAGIIWRDVLFAAVWLVAAAITYAVSGAPARAGVPVRIVALLLCAFGVLLRPNAVLTAPVLAAYILWPARFYVWRSVILFVPAAALFWALIQLVYYPVLGAKKQHPLHSIMVFDLGGISHFTGQNQFPVTWSPDEQKLLLNGCYQPTQWDIYWRLEPCEFVMQKVEREQNLFGTPALSAAWREAVMRHPLAWLQHRTAFMWNFLAGDNLTMWLADIENPPNDVFRDRPAFLRLVAIHDSLERSLLFKPVSWLLLCLLICVVALRRWDTAEGAFAAGVAGSAAVYVASFFAVGVSSDFRYAYWSVLAALSAGAVLAVGRRARIGKVQPGHGHPAD